MKNGSKRRDWQEALVALPVRHPYASVLTCLCAVAVLATGIRHLSIVNDTADQLPAEDPMVASANAVKKHVGDRAPVAIQIQADDVFSPAGMRRVSDVTEALKQLPGIVEVISLTTVSSVYDSADADVEIERIVDKMPATSAESERLRQRAQSDEFVNGQLVSTDGRSALVIGFLDVSASQEKAYSSILEIAKNHVGTGQVAVGGALAIDEEVKRGIQADLIVFLPIAIGFTLLGLLLAFGTARGMLLPIAIVVIANLALVGAMGFAGVPLSVVTLTIPIIVIAIGSSYGIHVVQRIENALAAASSASFDEKRLATIAAMRGLLVPLTLSAATSAIGIATLVAFRIKMIREFGVFLAAGVLFAAVCAAVIIPAIYVIIGFPRRAHGRGWPAARWVERTLASFVGVAQRRPRSVLLLTGLLIVVSAYGTTRVRLGVDPVELFPQNHSFRRFMNALAEQFGGAEFIDAVIDSGTENGLLDPRTMNAVAAFGKAAASVPNVMPGRSVADHLVRIHRAIVGEQDNTHQRGFDSREQVAQLLLVWEMGVSEEETRRLVDPGYRYAMVSMRVRTSDSEEQQRIYGALTALARETLGSQIKIDFGGKVSEWLAFTRYVVRGKIENIILSIVITFLMMALAFRALRVGLLATLPISITTLTTFGLMGFLGIRLNLSTALISSICIGVGIDFAIHFVSEALEQRTKNFVESAAINRAVATVGPAIAFDASSNIVGFSALVFSRFTPIVEFGWLISVAMATAAVMTLLVAPSLVAVAPSLLWVRKRS